MWYHDYAVSDIVGPLAVLNSLCSTMGTLISLCAKVSGRPASMLALRGPFLWVISTKERATISRASVERCWIYVCLFKAVVRAVKSRWHGQHACAKVYARLFCKISWVIKLALTVPDDFLYGWNLFLMMSGDSQCNKINGELQMIQSWRKWTLLRTIFH